MGKMTATFKGFPRLLKDGEGLLLQGGAENPIAIPQITCKGWRGSGSPQPPNPPLRANAASAKAQFGHCKCSEAIRSSGGPTLASGSAKAWRQRPRRTPGRPGTRPRSGPAKEERASADPRGLLGREEEGNERDPAVDGRVLQRPIHPSRHRSHQHRQHRTQACAGAKHPDDTSQRWVHRPSLRVAVKSRIQTDRE